MRGRIVLEVFWHCNTPDKAKGLSVPLLNPVRATAKGINPRLHDHPQSLAELGSVWVPITHSAWLAFGVLAAYAIPREGDLLLANGRRVGQLESLLLHQ